MKTAAPVCLAIAVLVLLSSCNSKTADEGPQIYAVESTLVRGRQIANDFLKKVGLPQEELKLGQPEVLVENEGPNLVTLMSKSYQFDINLHLSRVAAFHDLRMLDWSAARSRSKDTRVFFKIKNKALRELQRMAELLGAPKNMRFGFNRVDMPTKINPIPHYITAEFEWPFRGLPVRGTSIGMRISFSPHDGRLIDFSAYDDFEAEPSRMTLTADRACEIALKAAQKGDPYGLPVTPGEATMCYVFPASSPKTLPRKLRPAWVVKMLHGFITEVAVDAENGKVLGMQDMQLGTGA